jgi:hypothetical protein
VGINYPQSIPQAGFGPARKNRCSPEQSALLSALLLSPVLNKNNCGRATCLMRVTIRDPLYIMHVISDVKS